MINIYPIYTNLLFASLALALLLFGFLLKYRKDAITQAIMGIALVVISIETTTILSMYSTDASLAAWLHGNLRLAMYAFVSPTGFLFVHAFIYPRSERTTKYAIWILALPIITAIISLTNPWHHLFIRSYSMELQQGYFIRTTWQSGPWFWVHSGYSTLIGAGIFWLLWNWIRQTQALPRYRGIFIVSVVVLSVGSISLDTLGFAIAPGLLFLPISLGATCFLYLSGIWYLDLLDILPVVREALTRYMPDAVFVVDTQNRILDVNPAGEKMLGRPASQIIGKDIIKFVLRKERTEQVRKLLKGASHTVMPLIVQGTERFFDIIVTDIFIEQRVLTARLIVLRDVTELKQTEAALRESDTRYQLLAENIIDVIWILDLDTQKFRYVSPSVERLRGFTVEEVLAQDMATAITPSSLKKLLENLPSAYAEFLQGRPKHYVSQVEQPCKDGSTVWTETTTRFVYNSENNHIEVYGVSRNITERKQAEEKLHQLSRAVEQSPASIVMTDTEGNIEYVNPRFVDVTGYALDELIGQNPRILKSNLTPPETYQELWDSIRAGKEWQGEFINRKKSGEVYTESAIISPITDSEGNITHYMAVKEDITKLKELQRQEREIAALEYRQRLARDLHDAVSQTLFSARLTSEMLLRQKETIKPEALWGNIEHFAGLVKSALGEMRILLLELRPDGLAKAKLPILLSNLVDAAAGRTDARIYLDAPEEQHELPQDVKIAFYRIAQEALNNAIKHARSGKIKIELHSTPVSAQIAIEDDGQGFGQSENKGTQLGMNIMGERAEEIGAKLEISSQPGTGTRITCNWEE